MSHEIQPDTSSNHSDDDEPQASRKPMSHEIQPDPMNHPHGHEPQATRKPMSREFRTDPISYDDSLDVSNRKNYLKIGLPLYKASIRCDWKAAEAILDKNPDMNLLRRSITENGETTLHIAASAKAPKKKVIEFVRNLVMRMKSEDLELVNNNHSTALYLAAVAGNIETVKIMMEKNSDLDMIPGGGEEPVMPLYSAVLYGHKDVARYLYECSKNLEKDGWNYKNRISLLEKCVETDMFDIALKIFKAADLIIDPEDDYLNLLGLLARKPEAFHEKKSSNTKSNIIRRTIESDIALKIVKSCPSLGRWSTKLHGLLARKPKTFHETKSSNPEPNIIRRTIKSVSAFIGCKAETHVEKSDALPLLKILWEHIMRQDKTDIDDILRGPPDSIKSGFGRIHQTMQLKALIFYRLDKLEKIAKEITMNDTVKDQEREFVNFDKLKDLVFKYVVDMHLETRSLIKQENTTDEDQAVELQKLISEYIVKLHEETKNRIFFDYLLKGPEQSLPNLISDHIEKMRAETKIIDTRYSSRVMFIAAEMGNTNFLLELIRRRPDLIWQVDDNGLSIFHVAVKHRREGIYNLLYEIGSMKDMVTSLRDKDGNNMLHLAAMRTIKKNLEDVSGAALQMQRELLWFKEVERMIPPYLRESKNKDGFTPRELFTMEHQYLIDQGEKWMKSTASQCMVVATLIATIVFAAAFTVPGGYNQNDGIPMFKQKLSFVAFVVADAISLFLSSASILTFLSILTSRYAERDFVASLPMKLMLGLLTLFLSIGTMMVTFSVSFFVLYHKEMKWIPIFISLFAIIPAILYVALQFHLLVDVFRSTYGGKYLFKPENQVLFYENPKV